MDQTNTEITRLEKELEALSQSRTWLFIGGIAIAFSAYQEYQSYTFDQVYFLVETLLAVGCIGYSASQSYRQRKITAKLNALRAETQHDTAE